MPGGYTPEEWQAMMDNPEDFPDIIDVQEFGDTTYITVTPKVLPLVQPLHDIGLTPLADLIEPALRVIIEQTGYDRSISPGQPTSFRLIPIFNPITLAQDLAVAIPEGIEKALAGLGETTVNAPATPSTLARTANPSTLAALDTADPPAATTPVPESDGSVSTQSNGMETEPATPTRSGADKQRRGPRGRGEYGYRVVNCEGRRNEVGELGHLHRSEAQAAEDSEPDSLVLARDR